MAKNPLLKYDKNSNKGVMFFSASSVGDTKQLWDFGIREILVSYHYISKSFKFYDEFLPKLSAENGVFMTDSGGFSFIQQLVSKNELTEETQKEEYWLPYLKEYVKWLYDNREHIYVAANLDLDAIVGREVVDRWNIEYFKPLEKHMNIVYVAHRDIAREYNDYDGLKRLHEYCRRYEYVGVSQEYKDYFTRVYSIAKMYKCRVHGFAWTAIPLLKSCPFFSVDSTTWLGGVRYGTSYNYDGKNFRVNDHKKKYVRKFDKLFCKKYGINHQDLLDEKRVAINQYNLHGWLGARQEYLRAANIKLSNKPVNKYTVYATKKSN